MLHLSLKPNPLLRLAVILVLQLESLVRLLVVLEGALGLAHCCVPCRIYSSGFYILSRAASDEMLAMGLESRLGSHGRKDLTLDLGMLPLGSDDEALLVDFQVKMLGNGDRLTIMGFSDDRSDSEELHWSVPCEVYLSGF